WYGADNLEQYGVGSFRKLGENGLIRQLEQYFEVQVFQGIDPITRQEIIILVSVVKCAKYGGHMIKKESVNERQPDGKSDVGHIEFTKKS
ncbi:hypothetical protein, partial [Maritalea sp.]|uniref:hypothetical protein n=1 Tax=Maritalea sp. TaxID=2003361 RepID=UPI003EF371E8